MPDNKKDLSQDELKKVAGGLRPPVQPTGDASDHGAAGSDVHDDPISRDPLGPGDGQSDGPRDGGPRDSATDP